MSAQHPPMLELEAALPKYRRPERIHGLLKLVRRAARCDLTLQKICFSGRVESARPQSIQDNHQSIDGELQP